MIPVFATARAASPRRLARSLALALALAAPGVGRAAAAAPALAAPPAPAAPPARSAAAILADNVKALGGSAVLGRHHTMRLLRSVSIKGMGIEGTEERYATSSDKFLSILKVPGVGVIKQGSDGKSYWSEDPINGLRLLEGLEKEQVSLEGRWNAELHLDKLYKKITPAPVPAGAPKDVALECLEMQPPLGKPTIACFDASSHQRVFQSGRQATPQGEIPFEAHFSGWRDFQGVSLPTIENTTAGPNTIEARVKEVVFDEKLDPALFRIKRPARAPGAGKPTAPAQPAPPADPKPPR